MLCDKETVDAQSIQLCVPYAWSGSLIWVDALNIQNIAKHLQRHCLQQASVAHHVDVFVSKSVEASINECLALLLHRCLVRTAANMVVRVVSHRWSQPKAIVKPSGCGQCTHKHHPSEFSERHLLAHLAHALTETVCEQMSTTLVSLSVNKHTHMRIHTLVSELLVRADRVHHSRIRTWFELLTIRFQLFLLFFL